MPPPGTPPPVLRHEALLYASDEDLLEVAVPFVRAGLAAGEPTIVRLPDPERDAVLDALGGGELPMVASPDSVVTPLALLRRTHELVSEEHARTGRPVRVLGATPHEPWETWMRYEIESNLVLAALPMWGICPYDTRATSTAVLADVERTHPQVATADLQGAANERFEDPLVLLAEHGRRPDPLERRRADAELIDPSPHGAGDVLEILADATCLDVESRNGLRLATIAVVANAYDHGRTPVTVRIWTAVDRVVVTVTDAGRGTGDLVRGVVQDGPTPEDSRSLYHVREAVSDVMLLREHDGFTVRLVQHR